MSFKWKRDPLYPALQRMILKRWNRGEWQETENKRRARVYSLTTLGKKQLEAELSKYRRVSQAIGRVIRDDRHAHWRCDSRGTVSRRRARRQLALVWLKGA